MSNLLNLKGAKILTKAEQKAVNGGLACDPIDGSCPGDLICHIKWGTFGFCVNP